MNGSEWYTLESVGEGFKRVMGCQFLKHVRFPFLKSRVMTSRCCVIDS